MNRKLLLAGLMIAPWVLTGCSQPLESQVRGTVTLDGKLLDRGSIAFYPAASGTPAYGSIDADGNYAVKTGQGEGMKPDEYIVVVTVTEEQQPSADPSAVEIPPKLLSPRKYSNKQVSPLRFTVEPGEQVIPIELESD